VVQPEEVSEMKKELQDQLMKRYPRLFVHATRKYVKGELVLPMIFGCECGDGWYGLLDRLFSDISKADQQCELFQVKEKFGGLRVYTQGTTDEVYELIDRSEEESFKVCEQCGAPGKLRDEGGWLRTLCDKCNDERGKRWTDVK
jgi:hypothetical protein